MFKPAIFACAAAWALLGCSLVRSQPAAAPAAEPVVQAPAAPMSVDDVAAAYAKLVLSAGELDPGYVDAYYGPPAWREQARQAGKGAVQIQEEAQKLIVALDQAPAVTDAADPALPGLRKRYLKNQLGALTARMGQLRGEKYSFDDEARALYDVVAPHYQETDFEPALKQLDALLPKEPGTLEQRYNRYIERFAVPRARLESVMRAAIGYAQLRTQVHLPLPPGERFGLALVGGKPWSAYNWYQGGYASRIEVNADLPVTIDRVIQLASHEGYPGHHVYNASFEQALVRGRGWPEYQVYALYSPQSFIAEGSADFGVDLLFAGAQRLDFERELFDLAGLDPRQVEAYDGIVRLAHTLDPAEIEAARRYLDGGADAAQTAAWLQRYALESPERARQRVAFFDQYRSYIVNYSYGKELVRQYVEAYGGKTPGSAEQWRAFARLLRTPRVASDLAD